MSINVHPLLKPPSLEDHANGGIVKEKLLVALTKAHNCG